MTTPDALGPVLHALHQSIELGRVTEEALGGLQTLVDLSRDEPALIPTADLATKVLRLHRQGVFVLPEVVHLLVAHRKGFDTGLDPDSQLLECVHRSRDGKRPIVYHECPTEYPVVGFPPLPDRALKLIIPESIFPPGNWSQTFGTALLKPASRDLYRGKTGIELGTGSGVIAISLVVAGAARLIGLDLNPDAFLTGSLNALANLSPDEWPRVNFTTSDLLDAVSPDFFCDFVIGCLPQVPQTQESGTGKKVMADVYPATGAAEDLLGFGLLSRALRQAHAHLEEDGWVEFVVSGRLGLQTALELFERHGYHPEVTHQTRVVQDADPPMSAFVSLEEQEGLSFKFYVPDQAGPVSARQAIAYPSDQIQHDLFVIRGIPYRRVEKESARLVLADAQGVGYTGTPGREDEALRVEIAEHYARRTGIRMDHRIIFIGPSSQELFAHVVEATVYEGGSVLYAGNNWERFAEARQKIRDRRVIRSSSDLAEVIRLVEKENPRLVVLNLTRKNRDQAKLLHRLADLVIERRIHLVTAGFFHQTDPDDTYPLAHLLAWKPDLAPHLIVLHDLARRYALSTTRLAWAAVPDPTLYQDLVRLGEVTYSRVSTLGQRIALEVLKRFRPGGVDEETFDLKSVTPRKALARNSRLDGWRHYHSVQPSVAAKHPDPIRMDFGESEKSLPAAWMGFLQTQIPSIGARDLEREAVVAAERYLEESRGIRDVEIVAGPGVLPLQAATFRVLSRRLGWQKPLVFVPRPTYDVHLPLIVHEGGSTIQVRTEGSKIQPSLLRSTPSSRHGTVLLLTQPTNPGGQYYTAEELEKLRAETPDWTILSDEVFGLLELGDSRLVSPASLPKQAGSWEDILTFFGLSKEFGQAGGLRAGFVATRDRELAREIRRELLTPMDPIAVLASLYGFDRWEEILANHQAQLGVQKRQLEGFLRRMGLPFLPSEGGFGVLADFSLLYGRRFGDQVITEKNIAEILEKKIGLIIHPPGWSHTPWVRLTYSIQRLEEALLRLERFLERVQRS